MMKKTFLYVLAVIAAALCLTSCQQPSFDETALIGKWQEVGTQLFYTYNSDHSGKTWDEEEVLEEDATSFTWTLNHAELTQIHITQMGETQIPKIYTITELTANKLVYEDDFGKEFSFNKVN